MSSATPAPRNLAPKLAGIVGGTGALGVAALAWWAFSGATASVVNAHVARAEGAGAELGATLNAHLLDTLPSLFPERGAVSNWEAHGSGLSALHQQIEAAATRHGFAKVRTLHLQEPAAEQVTQAPETRHSQALSVLVSSAEAPAWGAAVDYRPEMRGAWLEGRSASRLATSKRTGTSLTTWVPIQAPTGRTVAVLELSENIDGDLSLARQRAGWGVAAAVLLVAGAAWAVGRASRDVAIPNVPEARPLPLRTPEPRAIKPAKHSLNAELAAAMTQLELGDLETPIETADPAMTARFEALRERLAKAATAEARMRSLEALSDPRITKRRDAIAALGDAPMLVLDAGGGRRAEAWLVDVHYGGLVLRVAPYSVVDLAPGMPVDIAWTEGDATPFALALNRRRDTEEGVEYTFSPPAGGQIPGMSAALREIAYSRQTPRVSAEFLDVSAALLAGSDGVLATQVVDISADGLGIQVAVPPSELAVTGTRVTLVLQLAADQAELEFAVILRSVRPSDLGCWVGLEFDPLMTRDYDTSKSAVQAWVDERLRAVAESAEGAAAMGEESAA
ncbi:hypothetical protein LBMAG42_35920 [Deltaproteobacteria bacterium]|nr:hypothetical protein LBMAG42_35920 [Deltaproteobacteria bacterium]